VHSQVRGLIRLALDLSALRQTKFRLNTSFSMYCRA